MKFRSWFTYLAAAILGLLVMIWVLGLISPGSAGPGRSVAPRAAMFLPRQSPLVLSLLVNPDDLSPYRKFLGGNGKSGSDFSQPLQQLFTHRGLNYSQDIQPWLGEEMTLAVTSLDIDRQPQNGQQPGYLIALEVGNFQQSRKFLDTFWQKQSTAGQELSLEQYQGVKLISTKGKGLNGNPGAKGAKGAKVAPGLTPISTALVGKQFLLIGNDPKVVREAINNLQAADLALANASDYQQAIDSLEYPRIGFAFLNLPALARWQQKSLQPEINAAPPVYDRLAVAVGANQQGLLLDTALIATSSEDSPDLQPQFQPPGKGLKYISNNSALVVTGLDLETTWTQLNQGLQGYPQMTHLLSQSLRDAGQRWGLEIPEDIFAWVKGEYSLGLLPTHLEPGNSPAVNWIFVAENTDPELTQQSIQRLDHIAQQQGFAASPLPLAKEPVVAWTKLITQLSQTQPQPQPSKNSSTLLQTEVVGTHLERDDYTLLASSLGQMQQSLDLKRQSLLEDIGFKRAIAPLATPNKGYLYLDWPKLRPFLKQKIPLLQTLEELASPLFDHLRSLSLVSLGRQHQIQRGQIFIRFS
jgi:Protein of unknown function (DUF3352)